MPKIFPKSIQTCFELVLGQIFRKISAQFSMESRVFENFQKNQKSFKLPKMPKIVPKSIQTCFERVLGQTFRKIFAQFSMEGRVFENFQKNQKKIAKFQKCPKSLPKASKRVLNLFWVKFFEIFFCPVFRGGSSFRKFSKKKRFKFPKMPKIVPKSIETCFELVLGQIFRKISAQFSMESRVFENFQKNQKSFKLPKMPKIVPKSIQTCFERVLGQTFRKIFAQFSMEGRVFENFQKNQKNCKNPKNAQNRSQKHPNLF